MALSDLRVLIYDANNGVAVVFLFFLVLNI